MGLTTDIGRRIELVPMDSHCQDITVALYCQQQDLGPAYKVHTYSDVEGSAARVDFLIEAMQILGSMELTTDHLLHFTCWSSHEFAIKRLFLEACKHDPSQPLTTKPLHIADKKAGCNMRAGSLGNGMYQINAVGEGSGLERRISAITRGLARLGELSMTEGIDNQAYFTCDTNHDALVGLLLIRAPNVRAAMREAEEASSRGILAAPSSQE
jgi:hypothetical protein